MISISLQTPACIDAFKKVARSIKINPENHLYLELSDSVHASGDKKTAWVLPRLENSLRIFTKINNLTLKRLKVYKNLLQSSQKVLVQQKKKD
ncbi:unknown protein [Parachlamydia acanthamoebae UV-7]|uniref:Uncharacterized protein n=1 Tax=Parachlamydia acanthamoebae (strain UV7) TaxID=765952 RepID=F8KUW2_PARAV|nr:hypothetical protein [Parachlamydia acanthamoebae]CCB85027.1 unknown protein [Parachlamydia acanthamoebae UV-7]